VGTTSTIRAECDIGDRVVILHGCTLEGRLKLGKGVKLMAHIYIPSRTTIGSMVFVGPGTTFLNARFPMREGRGVRGHGGQQCGDWRWGSRSDRAW
jgi:UDP-3-O-[3-hydroxymyristoyl] glucosamine N-acyltransferase